MTFNKNNLLQNLIKDNLKLNHKIKNNSDFVLQDEQIKKHILQLPCSASEYLTIENYF